MFRSTILGQDADLVGITKLLFLLLKVLMEQFSLRRVGIHVYIVASGSGLPRKEL